MGNLTPGIFSIIILLAVSNNPVYSQMSARSCAELKQKGLSMDGTYTIDPDGPYYGIAPFNVSCAMSKGVTTFEHTGDQRLAVTGYEEPYSYEWLIDYGGLTPDQIGAVVDASDHCTQYIKYECFHAMIRDFVAWYNRHGKIISSWGGAPRDTRTCMCGVRGNCQAEKELCNCDMNDWEWREDGGNITDKADLPVTAIRAGETGSPNEKAYITLGPLVCWNDPRQTHGLEAVKSMSKDKTGIPIPRVTKRSITSTGIDVNVTCDSDSMTVYMNIEVLLQQGVRAKHIHFFDDDCIGKGYGRGANYIRLHSAYDRCDFMIEQRGDNIVFSNNISCDKTYPDNAVITRHICDMAIDVRCELPSRQVKSRFYVPTSSPIEQDEVGYGTFSVGFFRYTDSTFNRVHSNEVLPVHLREPLYYALNLTSNSAVTLFINRCWSTPTSDPQGQPTYDLISEGCRSDTTVRFYPMTPVFKGFSFEAFQFIDERYSQVYLHCEVIACPRADPSSRCAQGCRGRGRKRRSLGGLPKGSSSKPRILSLRLGPFVKSDDTKSGVSMKPSGEFNHTFISGFGAASFCVFVGMMALYTVMKARAKKMGPHRDPY